MLRWIVGSSLKFRYLVVALAAALMFFGVQQLQHSAIDVFPEFSPPKVEVQTPALGLSANQVEALVTIPLEQTLNGVPGLDEIRSKSVESLSSIEMIFKPGSDLLTARQHVAERIAQISPQLPTWASPPFMIQPLSATSRVMKIGLTTTDPGLDLIDLSMTTYWKIRTRLMRVPGVANVPIWGERIEMPTIQIDPDGCARTTSRWTRSRRPWPTHWTLGCFRTQTATTSDAVASSTEPPTDTRSGTCCRS